MLDTHKRIFSSAALQLKLWILVRVTNEASLKYIGSSGYAPKRIDCKAKTAKRDVDGKKLAGLVVSPFIYPGAFDASDEEGLSKIFGYWNSMHIVDVPGDKRPGLYYHLDNNQTSQHFGCLMYAGKYIHGDYDLYDIVDPGYTRNNLALVSSLYGVRHMQGLHYERVKRMVNNQIGVDMIQHSGEAQFSIHTRQDIDVFMPDGGYKRITELSELHKLYREDFNGRITLADNFPRQEMKPGRMAASNVTRIDSHPDFFRNKKR